MQLKEENVRCTGVHVHCKLQAEQRTFYKKEEDAKCRLGCFRKTLFRENQKYNPSSNSLGVSLKVSKRFFDCDKV